MYCFNILIFFLALTCALTGSEAQLDVQNQQMTVDLETEKVSVLQFGGTIEHYLRYWDLYCTFLFTTDISQQVHNALISLPKLLPEVEKTPLTGRSHLLQDVAYNRNVLPVDSKERDVEAAVPAAVPSAEPSDKGLPTAAVNNSNVDINMPLVTKNEADKVSVVKEEVDNNKRGTPPSDSLVPQEWLRFK